MHFVNFGEIKKTQNEIPIRMMAVSRRDLSNKARHEENRFFKTNEYVTEFC